MGEVPSYNYFDSTKVSLIDYNEYKKRFNDINLWSLKSETIKYCEIDCISLHQVIIYF